MSAHSVYPLILSAHIRRAGVHCASSEGTANSAAISCTLRSAVGESSPGEPEEWISDIPDTIGKPGAAGEARFVGKESRERCLSLGTSRVHQVHGHPTYAEMAAHYGTAVLPTRPRRPRDKVLPTATSANRSRSASLLKYRPEAGFVTLPAPCRAPASLAARLLRLRRARTRCEATIDHKLRTGHVARCVGGEE